VIPVGQTWPWLPADQVHLREPLVEPGEQTLVALQKRGPLGLRQHIQIVSGAENGLQVRIYPHRLGYHWHWERATWALQYVRAPSGTLRAVLMRNRQPLAALQSQGRLLNRWIELVYDGRGYRLLPAKREPGQCLPGQTRAGGYLLQDREGETLLHISESDPLQIKLYRTQPLPLLVAVLMQIITQEPNGNTRKEEPK